MSLRTGKTLFAVSSVFIFILCLLPVLFGGCGSGCGGDVAPDGSTITIFPKDFKLTDGGSSVTTTTQDFTISVHNADGLPLNDVELVLGAVGQDRGLAQLMTTSNANMSTPATVCTGDDGTYRVRIQLKSGTNQNGTPITYKFQLEATSGTAGGLAKIDVKALTTTTGSGG